MIGSYITVTDVLRIKTYLLEESCVVTWMVSNVHMTMMNGMIT